MYLAYQIEAHLSITCLVVKLCFTGIHVNKVWRGLPNWKRYNIPSRYKCSWNAYDYKVMRPLKICVPFMSGETTPQR